MQWLLSNLNPMLSLKTYPKMAMAKSRAKKSNNRKGSCSFWFRSKEDILHIFEQAYLSLRGKAIVSNSQ